MGDEEAPPYSWTSLEPPPDGAEEPLSGTFVKAAGRAKVVYPNGDTYEGGFNDAKQKHGRGVYTWSTTPGSNPWVPEEGFPDGKVPVVRYEGQYVEGKKHGIGKITFPNGEKYHGMWDSDRFQGEGTYYYGNGDIYSGAWVRGVRQGEGTMLFASDESQLVGRWERGTFVAGKWLLKDGTSWTGPFASGKPLGRGVFYFPNGTMQEGEYVRQREGATDDDDAAAAAGDSAAGGAATGGADAAADDEELDLSDLKIVWRGGPIRAANTAAAEIVKAPVTTA